MQKFWKVVLEGRGCTEKQRLALRLRLGRGAYATTLESVAVKMAELGFTNGGGKPYSRARISQFVAEGFQRAVLTLADRAPKDGRRFHEATEGLLRQKVHYSCKTESDPYLSGRLEWWQLRKVGKKPSGSEYDKKKHRNKKRTT